MVVKIFSDVVFKCFYTSFFYLACVKYFTASNGEITSPNYPDNYDTRTNCHYYITVPENEKILLTFNEMDIENSPSCNYDFIRVRDGGDDTVPVLGKYCGKVAPNPKMSTGNKLYIRFRSDDRQTKKGFRLSWNAVKDIKTTVTTTKKTAGNLFMFCFINIARTFNPFY